MDRCFINVFCFVSSLMITPSLTTCGYESCNKEVPGMINVHLVPHTHNDPGWLNTVDQYYYRQVEFILDTVIDALEEDPSRRFTYVEMSFFTRWWAEQDDKMKKRVKDLVDQGRLEFTLGGWVMNDEAAAHYSATIDQHTLGFDFLRKNFGKCGRTRVGWQIDPFGHSREQTSIFAQLGFDGYFFGRLDYQDYENRQKTHTLEMVWHGSPDNLGSVSDLFTGILPDHYHYPTGFAFDVSKIYLDTNYNQKYIHDDPTLNDYNVDAMVKKFTDLMEKWNSWFGTGHLISTMGGDFNYVDAHLNYKEMDKLIKYVNAKQADGSKVNLLYSTPACYLKALYDDQRIWTTKSDDFFPYAHREHSYWTGYFTSRPAEKRYTRFLNGFLQKVKQLTTFAKLDNSNGDLDKVSKLADAVSLGQHHDALTGTEKQVVAFDYSGRLSRGQVAAQGAVQSAYSVLMSKGNGAGSVEQVFCDWLNVSVCPISSGKQSFEVTFYNPLSWAVNFTTRFPFLMERFAVYKEDGKTPVNTSVFPTIPTVSGLVPKGLDSSIAEVVFTANLPPLGFATYFIKNTDENRRSSNEDKSLPQRYSGSNEIVMKGKYVELHFENDVPSKLVNKVSNISVPFSQDFFYYKAHAGNNSKPEFQASGAYIFRPQGEKPVQVKLNKTVFFMNDVAQICLQQYEDWLVQVIRVYEDKPYIEFEWTVGPIPIHNGGKEIVTRYNIPEWGNKGVFYTDSNGREIMQRKLNYRPTWKVHLDEPVAGNYFPVDTHFHIKDGDNKNQFSVLTDRAQGGSSLNDGDVELMLHRRLVHDDRLGVNQALNEPGYDKKGLVARGSHFIFVETTEKAARQYRPLAQEIFLGGRPTFSKSGLSPADYIEKYKTTWSGLAKSLPPEIHLLTLERFRGDGPVSSPSGSAPYLVRFEHFYEVSEVSKSRSSVSFDINGLFTGLTFVKATELALGGNIAAADIHRLDWKFKESSSNSVTAAKIPQALDGSKITLKPMQIVTLQVDFKA